eukprot:TRINITY_DN21677_c0_g2_i2.p1 TRINITY_DN21677_c0_g2~~TRINITY_DN21677_c0_g2_i2.p1  ORF type:complete len:388 (-),score=44.41 TRINITY_DN21677_c0_g2_i2:204-1367(-)
MASHVRGTRAPDQVQLWKLAEDVNDPLRSHGKFKSGALDRRLAAELTDCGGRCVYLPEVVCKEQDFSWLEALALDVAGTGASLVPHRTQKRMQVFAEALQDSAVYRTLLARILSVFGLSMVDSWVNVYRDGRETTGAHHDHYNLRKPHACATLNLNLGATRHLCMESLQTGEKFYIEQRNGSLLAFDARANCSFRHSVPADPSLPAEPSSLRLSITVFAIEGAQPSQVVRDAENVPPGVPLTVSWSAFDIADHGWTPPSSLQNGHGPRLLLNAGPLLRGHKGKGKGKGKGKVGKDQGKESKGKVADDLWSANAGAGRKAGGYDRGKGHSKGTSWWDEHLASWHDGHSGWWPSPSGSSQVRQEDAVPARGAQSSSGRRWGRGRGTVAT